MRTQRQIEGELSGVCCGTHQRSKTGLFGLYAGQHRQSLNVALVSCHNSLSASLCICRGRKGVMYVVQILQALPPQYNLLNQGEITTYTAPFEVRAQSVMDYAAGPAHFDDEGPRRNGYLRTFLQWSSGVLRSYILLCVQSVGPGSQRSEPPLQSTHGLKVPVCKF